MTKPIERIDVSGASLDRLRKLTDIPHEHYEGMNECSICDQSILDAASNKIIRLTAEFNETFAKMVVLKSKNAELTAELENEKKERLINANAGRMQKERAEAAEQQVAALVEGFKEIQKQVHRWKVCSGVVCQRSADDIFDITVEILSTIPERAKKSD